MPRNGTGHSGLRPSSQAPSKLAFLCYTERFPELLSSQKKTRRLRKQTGNYRLQTGYRTGASATRLLTQSVFGPIKLLFISSTILLVSICGALASSYTYIVITTLTGVFEETYGFPERQVGITYQGLGTSVSEGPSPCAFAETS